LPISHPGGLQQDLQLDGERTLRAVHLRVEVRERLRIAGWAFERYAERRQRFCRDHPGRDRAGEVLRQERAQRLILPALNVARRPVVEQGHAEQVRIRRANVDRLSLVISLADEPAEFEFVVEALGWADTRRWSVGGLRLPTGT